jgi:glucan phosphoethanolaminetransferase (alkaline phosphatase superfamily)
LLIQQNPNVVLIILESFSSDLLGCMGARQSAAPFLDSLASRGLLFTQIYSSGFRTDQGLPSLLSGFPATPVFSIITYPEKSLPCHHS